MSEEALREPNSAEPAELSMVAGGGADHEGESPYVRASRLRLGGRGFREFYGSSHRYGYASVHSRSRQVPSATMTAQLVVRLPLGSSKYQLV